MADEYVVRTTDTKRTFPSGARRHDNAGKPRPDLISPRFIQRLAMLLARGAEAHGERNWELGIPLSVFLESLERHLLAYKLGDRTEDHLAAIGFNVMGMVHFERTEMDDINSADSLPIVEEEWTQPNLFDSWDDMYLEETEDVPTVAQSLVNWQGLKEKVDQGLIDSKTVAWPEDYEHQASASQE